MSKLKASSIFFSLAVFIGLAWLGVEFLLYRGDQNSAGELCEFTGTDQLLSGKRLLSIESQSLWVFDSLTEKVLKFPFSSENGLLSDTNAERIEFSKNKPFLMQNNVFLLESKVDGKDLVFPAYVSNQKSQLARPLQLCGKTLRPDPAAYAINGQRIMYFDRESSMLGVWTMPPQSSLPSTGISREPEQIFRVQASLGFVSSTCDQSATKVKSYVRFSKNNLLLINDSRSAVETHNYSLNDSLGPKVELSKLDQIGVNLLKNNLSTAQYVNYDEKSLLLERSRYFWLL